jgi:hypothetical protein
MTDTETKPPVAGELCEIPAEGALGLLAYGAKGLLDWRKKRSQVEGADWRDRLAAELSEQTKSESQEKKQLE